MESALPAATHIRQTVRGGESALRPASSSAVHFSCHSIYLTCLAAADNTNRGIRLRLAPSQQAMEMKRY